MGDQSPKTPTKVERIPRDDSFKTCKAELPSPRARRLLRMTPARNSIYSGGNFYKEGQSSGKKFNSRTRSKKNTNKSANETTGSNETFIRCEQDLMFDRDSLEVGTSRLSSTPKSMKEMEHVLEQLQEVALEPLTKQPTFLKDKNDNEQVNSLVVDLVSKAESAEEATKIIKPPNPAYVARRKSPIKISSARKPVVAQVKKSPQKKTAQRKSASLKKPVQKSSASPKKPIQRKLASPKKTFLIPSAPPARNLPRPTPSSVRTERSRRELFTPRTTYRVPACLKSTASKYLSQCNNSRIARAQSFKSTAELERDYFKSLRSF